MHRVKAKYRITCLSPEGFRTWSCLLLCFANFLVAAQEQNSVEPPVYVFDDQFVNCTPSGTMGSNNGISVTMSIQCEDNPYKGKYCYKLGADGTEGWSGVYVHAAGKFGRDLTGDEDLTDLSNHKYLVFYARTDEEGYVMGRLGMGEGNNDIKQYEGKVPLYQNWRRYVIELKQSTERSAVNGMFVAVFEGKGTIFLDEIFYADRFFKTSQDDIVFQERKAPLDSNAFYVYDDQWVNGIPSGHMGEKNGVSMSFDFAYRSSPFMGPKCIKVEVDNQEIWRGIHIQYAGKWNERITLDDKLPDLQEYDKLVFYGRTDGDYISIPEIGMGAGTWVEERRYEPFVELGPEWQRVEVDLKDTDLRRVNTLLYMVLPAGTFYLDEIRYLKSNNTRRSKPKKEKQ